MFWKRLLVVLAVGLVGCPPGTPIQVPDAFCGDGAVDEGEECDNGSQNDDAAACTVACRNAVCGDGLVLDGVEECDEATGNSDSGECTSACAVAVCGDGLVFDGEEACDDGADNADTAACTSQCELAACGDGLVHAGVEECDQGTANNDGGDCTTECTTAVCGDGFVQIGVEQCDLGEMNGGDLCTDDCMLASCGDGILNGEVEECDEGVNNDDNGNCTTACTLASCGDGFVFTGVEECDDGVANADDAECTSQCNDAVCGDGLILAGVEECDDGAGNANTAGCTAQCAVATCGDGLTWAGVEECDDNNGFGGDGCSPTCALPDTRMLLTADARIVGEEALDTLEWTSSAGDVNGDGFDDLLLGAPGGNVGSNNLTGRVYLFHGPIQGIRDASTADASFPGDVNENFFGQKNSGLGDLDGDGFDDFGMRLPSSAGDVFLAYGPVAGEIELDALGTSIEGAISTAWGWDLKPLGDINNDGNDDILIGAYLDDEAATNAGAAHVVLGPVTGTQTSSIATAKVLGEAEGDNAGRGLAAGDVSGDGVPDLIVGAPNHDAGGDDAGAVYIYEGPVNGNLDLANADAKLVGEAAGDEAGYFVDFAGDLDNDGFGDVVVSGNYTGNNSRGAVYVLYGPLSGTIDLSNADATFTGELLGDRAASSVAGVGDVNGDGFDDLLFGAHRSDVSGNNAGRAYLVFGPVSGTNSLVDADVTFVAEEINDGVGRSVSGAGDVDADGLADLMIGSINGAGGDNGGVVYLWYGSSF
ncbi:MAG: hypothetical protein AAGA48_14440 [Myxococcota bacterium]